VNVSDEAISGETPVVRTVSGEGAIDFRTAARALIDARNKDNAAGEAAPEEAAPPVGQQESAGEADGAPREEAPAEPQGDDPAELPPIDPPKGWTKDEKERFKSLPRETQEYLSGREQERDRDFRTRQNELAEKSKAITAKERQTEEVRGQYETALPLLLQALQSSHAGEFADVRTMQDVQKMASEDWPRYIRWDAAQKQIAAVQQEVSAASQRQMADQQRKFGEFASEQDRLFAEKVPEFKDKAVAEKLQKYARDTLIDIGFSDEELSRGWLGQDRLSLRDHRMQLLIRDAILGRELAAEKAKGLKNVTAKPLPPVQRPGAAPTRGLGDAEQLKSLQKEQESATGRRAIEIGAEILKLQRKAGSR
jgi:hypothetical protein